VEQDSAREELVLPGNVCFGCGEANRRGLHVSMYRNSDAPDVLLGEFRPGPDVVGVPGITHGGTIYTAMDCMATWSGMVLKQTKAMWVLRSATTTYHRPALQGDLISLSATIENEGGEWDAIQVRVDARNSEGDLLVEGSFKAIPLPPERFKALIGAEELPEGWAEWLRDEAIVSVRSSTAAE
jgi:acyl-coenzyme A thioesterase PaaI-like protein